MGIGVKPYKIEVTIHNFKDTALEYPYIIASCCDGKLWYYGVGLDGPGAYEIAAELAHGVVIDNTERAIR